MLVPPTSSNQVAFGPFFGSWPRASNLALHPDQVVLVRGTGPRLELLDRVEGGRAAHRKHAVSLASKAAQLEPRGPRPVHGSAGFVDPPVQGLHVRAGLAPAELQQRD